MDLVRSFALLLLWVFPLAPAAFPYQGDVDPSAEDVDPPSDPRPFEQILRERIALARPLVGILEVQGPLQGSIVRQAGCWLLEPGIAVTSAYALAGGHGATVRFGEATRSVKVCGLDLMQDVAYLALDPPLDVALGLELRKGHLLGNERAAVLGHTVLMEDVTELCTLTGAVKLDPLCPIAQVQNLTHQGLTGAPLINERGQVIGMLSSRIFEESGTRFVVSGSGIGQVTRREAMGINPSLVPAAPDNADSSEFKVWAATQVGIQTLLAGHPGRAVEALMELRGERARLWLGLALTQNDRDVEAIEILNESLQWAPGSSLASLIQGQAHHNLLQHREEVLAFNKARSVEPESTSARMALANAYAHTKRGQDALQLLTGVLQDHPNYLPAILLRGQILVQRLRLSEARTCFDAVLKWDPKNPDAWCGMGQLNLRQQSAKRALQCFERALESTPDSTDALLGCIEVDIDQRDWDQALARIQPLLERLPRNVRLLTLAGQVSLRQRKLESARDLYEKVTFLDPDNSEAFLGLGLTFKEMLEHDRAIAAFDEVLRIDPKNSAALFNAGTCHLMQGNRGDARSRYKVLMTVDPVAADRLFRLIYNK